MLRTITFKKLAICTLTITAAGQGAFAHDLFDKQALEGNSGAMHLIINHGCDGNPIIAQSVLFPTVNPELRATDSNGNPVPAPAGLIDVIQQGTLEGVVDLIQDKSIFMEQDEKMSALTNVIGFYGKSGKLKVNLTGSVPIQFNSLNFTPTTCYSHLYIAVAVADICSTQAPALQPGKASLFIPDNGSQIAETAKANGLSHGIGEPSILQVDRDLVNNPFLDADGNLTNACGDGITAWVTPSAADVDANLGIPLGYSRILAQEH